MKIFIFEDEFPIANSLQQHLYDLGYQQVTIASNLQQAHQVLSSNFPDIAVLDIRIPNDDEAGIKIAKYINSIETIPIIFMTANEDDTIIEKALGTKPDAYLSKIFSASVLLYTLEQAILKASQRRSANESQEVFFFAEYLLLRRNNSFDKVKKTDIQYAFSEGGVLRIVTVDKTYIYSSALTVFLNEVDDNQFIRVGRNYAINVLHLSAFLPENCIQVGQEKIQLRLTEYRKLFHSFKTFRSKGS